MKVTLNWLKQYVDFNWSPEELADHLTRLGLEVESLRTITGEFDGVVVAQVLASTPHPNADKLSVCRVNDGHSERQIVCGASNFKPGDMVPLILPGASLPPQPGHAQVTIKVGKIRGVESHGMMCSGRELGLSSDAEGILVLRPDAAIGQPFADYLGRAVGDAVLDLEITPNRPDLNSVIGIAREVAAATGNPLRLPFPTPPPGDSPSQPIQGLIEIHLEAPDLCPRYTARVLRGVKINPSPDWLRNALEKVGLRPINNVVDVTNYVMLETGQPLHAFDYHTISRSRGRKTTETTETTDPQRPDLPTLLVRRASPGESFTTLDGHNRQLSSETLLIADTEKGIAIAGVMGGVNSEIGPDTVDVLLESAWFLPASIRRTSKSLSLRTDASYRFERGVDIELTDLASLRAAALIVELAGGELVPGVVDAYPQPHVPRQITLRHPKANALLGLNLPVEDMEHYLTQLGLKTTGRIPRPVDSTPRTPTPTTFVIPSWRPDLKRETDLIEEIARLYGVDRIPSTPPRGAVGAHPFDAVHDQLTDVRRILTGLGLFEAQGQTLVSDAAAALTATAVVRLSNPLSADMTTLRPSLLPGLLDTLRHNLARQNTDLGLFEVGRIFIPGTSRAPREESRVAIAITGRRSPRFWKEDERHTHSDLHDLKGILDEFLEHLGLRGVLYARRPSPTPLLLESATVTLGGKVPLGEFGQLLPALARQFDLRDPAFLAELNLDDLLARRVTARGFKPLPQFPSVRRDIALLVPSAVTHDSVLAAVRQARVPNLESVELFDVYQGGNVPQGRKSAAYAFTYRHPDRTLTDTEVNSAHEELVLHLQRALDATLRA